MGIKKYLLNNLSREKIYFLRCIHTDIIDVFKKYAPPEYVLKKMFKRHVGYELNLDNPKTFNEKLQWLKLHDHKDIYTTMVDKYAVKKYVADMIGEQYVIPTLGVWNHFDEIDFEKLPKQFVLKNTHDSGRVVIVKDKNNFDIDGAREKLEFGIRRNYYYSWYEWPYKNVPPRIIAEKFMADGAGANDDLTDYKFMCFNGKVRCTFTCTDRFAKDGLKVTFFDNDWQQLPFQRHYPAAQPGSIAKPKSFELMKELSERLAKDIPFVRVDFYDVGDEVYFGELTFFPGAGMEEFTPQEYDGVLGEWIKIDNVLGGGYILVTAKFFLWLHEGECVLDKNVDTLTGLIDYKFYCFNGEPKFLYVSQGLDGDHALAKMNFVDLDWQLTPFQRPEFIAFGDNDMPVRPKNLDKMINFAKLFSKNIPFLRVDMYVINGQIYMSEFTFYPGAGFTPFKPDKWEMEIGKWINLSDLQSE